LLLYFDDRNRKYVLLLLPFAVLPDLDHFAPLYAPREMLHNVFLLVPPLAIALYGLKTKKRSIQHRVDGRLCAVFTHRARFL
jgi:glycopeptide antibiotics resistance protein